MAGTAEPKLLRDDERKVDWFFNEPKEGWSLRRRHGKSASFDGIVRVWDVAGAAEPKVLRQYKPALHCWPDDGRMMWPDRAGYRSTAVAFSPTGKLLAASSRYRSAAVAVSSTGKLLAASSLYGTVQLWDVAEAAEPKVLRQYKREVDWWPDEREVVAFSADGTRLASGGWGDRDPTVRVWDVVSGEELRLEGHRRPVNSVAFSPDGRRLVSGSDDTTVRLWDVSSGAELAAIAVDRRVSCVALSPDSKLAAIGLDTGDVAVFEVIVP